MPDMSEALEQINEDNEQIVGMFYLTDSSQVCIVVQKNDLSTFKKFVGHKDQDEKEDRA
jgi:hypothetical protein